jgi:hypothetical protein
MIEEITNQDSQTRDVFISYASQDVAIADAIVATPETSRLTYGLAE